MNKASIDEQIAGARAYEALHVPALFKQWCPRMLDAAGVGRDDRVLDVACGTGVVARLAAERVGPSGTVAAVDLNPAMLSVARSVPSTGAVIRWYETSAESIPLPDDAFDVAGWMNRWAEQGPTHHVALGVGHRLGTLQKFAQLLGLEFVRL